MPFPAAVAVIDAAVVELNATTPAVRVVHVMGSVVALDRRAGEPVDLCVNGKLLARGEVVMVDECYGLRITEIVDVGGRMEAMT